MDLSFRHGEFRDLQRCQQLLSGHLAYSPDIVTQLSIAWRRLLRDEAAIMAVIEDLDRLELGILGFGLSVFVTDAFMAEARAAAEPYLSARLIRKELGQTSPILRPAGIRTANAGNGLNLVLLHYAESRNRLDSEALRRVRYAAMEGFLWWHRGYLVKEVLQEFWDEIDPSFVRQGWGRVRTDYDAFYLQRQLPVPQPGLGPCLVGLTREEVLAEPGSTVMAPLFVYTRPRLSLRRGEQQLLLQALRGHTDRQLARALHIALPTVKSRWRAIYERVSERAPEVLPEPSVESLRRGKEKRRQLLEYIRRHPEELRLTSARRARS